MNTDTYDLKQSDQQKALQQIRAYLNQVVSLPLPTEQYADLTLQELIDATKAQDETANSASQQNRVVEQMRLTFAAAMQRDMQYGVAGRIAMMAYAYDSAIRRSFAASVDALKVGYTDAYNNSNVA